MNRFFQSLLILCILFFTQREAFSQTTNPLITLPNNEAIGWAANASGFIRTGQTATNTLLLQARDVDGAAWTTFGTLTAANTPTFDLSDSVTKGGNYIYRAGGTDVPLTDGGTGASTAATARANLGSNLYWFEIDSPGIINPADATTYYGGNFLVTTTPNVTYAQTMQSGTVVKARVLIWTGGVLGTTETATLYLRVNNTTDYQLSNAVVFNGRVYSHLATGLSIPLTTTDTYELKLVCPTWVTNPTSVQYKVVFEMER